MNPKTKAYLLDLGERVVVTFLQAFGAALILGGFFSVSGVVQLSVLQKAALAGVAAVLSLVKGLVAKWVADPDSASLVPVADSAPVEQPSAF